MNATNMISILYVISDLNRGGAESHLLRILPELKSRGLNVAVLTLRERGVLASSFETCGIEVISPKWTYPCNSKFINLIWYGVRFLQLYTFFIWRRPKLIHFFLPQSYLIGGLAALLARVPIKVMSRRSMNYYQRKYPSIIRRYELWLHGKMVVISGNSQKVINQLQKEEAVSVDNLKLIYNGISIPCDTSKKIRKELEIPPQTLVITKVANLIPYKGHRDLIDACALLKCDVDWKLLLVGNNSSNIQNDLELYVQKLGLSNRIVFLGARDDVEAILHESNVGILTSHEEGFSNSILEGMSAELPMIVTDVGGNAEAVVDNETGIVVPAHEPKKLALAIDRLLTNSTLRKEMGKKGKIRQKLLFSLERCVDDYQELYESLWDK